MSNCTLLLTPKGQVPESPSQPASLSLQPGCFRVPRALSSYHVPWTPKTLPTSGSLNPSLSSLPAGQSKPTSAALRASVNFYLGSCPGSRNRPVPFFPLWMPHHKPAPDSNLWGQTLAILSRCPLRLTDDLSQSSAAEEGRLHQEAFDTSP